MTDSDRDTSNHIALTTNICIELSNFLFIDLRKTGVAIATSINDILAQLVLINLISLMNRQLRDVDLVEKVFVEPLFSRSHPLLLFFCYNLTGWDESVLPDIRVIFHM